MIPATVNFTRVRGNTEPFMFQFQDTQTPPQDIPHDDIHISVYKTKKGGDANILLRKKLSEIGGGFVADTSDPNVTTYIWTPTPEETRLFPYSEGPDGTNRKFAYYEVEIWASNTQTTYIWGTIEGIGGLNDD